MNKDNEHAYWQEKIRDHQDVITRLSEDTGLLDTLRSVADLIVDTYRSGGKVLLCGNGGSAADCQHLAAELAGKFCMDRRPLEAVALTVNTSSLTAIGNDYGFDNVFARQVEGNGKKGDVLLGISTSGNSMNVIHAVTRARAMGISTVAMAGGDRHSKISEAADFCLHVPSTDTARIQEAHILMGHMLCGYIELALFGKGGE